MVCQLTLVLALNVKMCFHVMLDVLCHNFSVPEMPPPEHMYIDADQLDVIVV